MFVTSIGPFDGRSWEALCQQVFKQKYGPEGYQQIQASPGDFGLEGFTLVTGYGFQCYCPDKHYTRRELYEAQRDKITRDIAKLRNYETEIAARIGSTKLGYWVFVTPELDKNELLAHARTKEQEARGWSLSILASDFHILVRDADYYQKEINDARSAAGVALNFDTTPPTLLPLDSPIEQYEGNIRRKCARRLEPKADLPAYERLFAKLHQQTLENFLGADGFFRRIEETAPTLYFRLVRLINEFENHVVETAVTWVGTAEELTTYIREGVAQRVSRELAPEIDETTASRVARHMVARWKAVCQLDYE